MIVNWKQNRILVCGNGTPAGLQTLVPGSNIIPDGIWNELRPHLKDRIGVDLFEVGAKVTPEGKAKDGAPVPETVTGTAPGKLSLTEASGAIKDAFSIPVLEAWLKEESRESVRMEIYNRIKEIEKAIEAQTGSK